MQTSKQKQPNRLEIQLLSKGSDFSATPTTQRSTRGSQGAAATAALLHPSTHTNQVSCAMIPAVTHGLQP